ncbi:MAG: cytochrome C oxidase subunit IV family protein, partial [Planctomycetota bacterium]
EHRPLLALRGHHLDFLVPVALSGRPSPMTNEHIVSPRLYLAVFLALMLGTAATVWAARFDLGHLNIVVAMVLAVCKATLVVLYFMHLRYGSKLTWVFAAAGVLWLVLLIGLTMADILTRHWG